MKTAVIIVGSGGHAAVVADILAQDPAIEVAGFVDDFRPPGELACGHRVLGTLSDVGRLCPELGIQGLVVAIGDNWSRGLVADRLLADCPSAHLLGAVHPTATVAATARLGPGSVIMAGAVVGPCADIGPLAIVNTCAVVEHHCHLGRGSSIGPGAAIAGRVTVGEFSAIGIGAVVIEKVCVGENAVIGAGSVVVNDIPPSVVAFGCPARVVRQRLKDESYLR